MDNARAWVLVRYFLTGICGACVQVFVLWLWIDVFDQETHYLWGVVLGFCIALALTFPMQKYWTFGDRTAGAGHRQFIRYTVIALVSLGLNTFLMHVAKHVLENFQFNFFQMWYLLAQGVVVTVIAAGSYLSNRLLTFRGQQ